MAAAAELIAELGWGRVTTRAVAERAELPHGAVSYHFRGKQELLAEAALHAFQQAIPVDQFAALKTVDDLIGLIAAEVADPDAIDPVLSRLMLEAMREAERDPQLRERMGAMLGAYRQLMIETVRADQQRGAVFDGAPPEAIATVLGAVGDGLLLHALLDPELDIAAAVEALRALLRGRAPDAPTGS
jgi:AcrR family transcriptional regulator